VSSMVDKTSYSDLKAVFFNGTLKKSPEMSNTQGVIDVSRRIMEKQGVLYSLQHGIPAYGNLPEAWEAGTRFNFENPEYR
jgi:hypothetical protein